MFKICSTCARTKRTDGHGEWIIECRYCRYNPEVGITEYDSHWINPRIYKNTDGQVKANHANNDLLWTIQINKNWIDELDRLRYAVKFSIECGCSPYLLKKVANEFFKKIEHDTRFTIQTFNDIYGTSETLENIVGKVEFVA